MKSYYQDHRNLVQKHYLWNIDKAFREARNYFVMNGVVGKFHQLLRRREKVSGLRLNELVKAGFAIVTDFSDCSLGSKKTAIIRDVIALQCLGATFTVSAVEWKSKPGSLWDYGHVMT